MLLTVTYWLEPLNARASPAIPATQLGLPLSAPVWPLPELSAALLPLPALNCQLAFAVGSVVVMVAADVVKVWCAETA